MPERRKQGLFYYCDDKYSQGHKFIPIFFQIDATKNRSIDEALSIEVPEEEVGEPKID